MPTALLGVLFISATVLIFTAFVIFIRRTFPNLQKSKTELIFMQLVGSVYSVLLVFVLIAVWQQYEEARRTSEEEGAMLDSMWHIALAYPDEISVPIVSAIAEYSEAVSHDEWKTLAYCEQSQVAAKALADLRAAHFDVELPNTNKYNSLYRHSVQSLEFVAAHRLRRYIQSRTSVPDVAWFILLFGGLVLPGLSVFVREKNIVVHAAMTGLLTAMISTTLFVIVILDNPWSGSAALDSEAFEHIHSMQREMHPEFNKP